ncbi:MAG: MaoC family dehydratase [Gammaproteobacteria bacterium]|nr:MaoC family dehydratase [Gammaproteobacteria bacterium]MBT8064547.1 MaoC family dehydratase [Gammaproteobacteria bacterium]NNK32042.1 MaoC family dehydratase [Xanthomonadales bacterium]
MTAQDLHGYYFEDLEVGLSATFGKTFTDADVLMFAAVSGDTNPSHLNEEFAATTRVRTRVVHGMLTASLISAVLGTRLPGPGCLYVSQSVNFRAPVRAGDTVTARVVVSGLRPEKNFAEFETTCTVDGATVVDGSALIWVPSRG